MQMIFQYISGYFEDDYADKQTCDPVYPTLLGNEALASKPTLSRFFNRTDEETLAQFYEMERLLHILWEIYRHVDRSA